MGLNVQTGKMREHLRSFSQFVVVFFVFFFIIILVPNAKITPSASISGAALGTLLVYISTFVFTKVISYTFCTSVPLYNLVFGGICNGSHIYLPI